MNIKETVSIFHFGPGKVGKKFQVLFLREQKKLEKLFGTKLRIVGFADSNGFKLTSGVRIASNTGVKTQIKSVDSVIKLMPRPFIVIDTTASNEMTPHLLNAVNQGGYAILSNKKPLASAYTECGFLYQNVNSVFFETTVGAGLPVISTIKELLATGDEIIQIEGCFSGTLGYIFSELEKGKNFSKIVRLAKELGYTEPDPRDDLSGLDVARKALILSRLLGKKIELNQVKIMPLFTKAMASVSIDEFMSVLPKLDSVYVQKMAEARKKGRTLRFVATIGAKKTTVGLKSVALNSDLGSLRGPDNIIVIKTRRYYNNPMVIKGPGAGVEVTAAGVLGDLIKIVSCL